MTAVKTTRTGASVNVYLFLRKDDKILFLLRQNTGYGDGCYGLISGHVEDNEPATAAMVREAQEEAGIVIAPEDLKPVHVQHRVSTRFNIDIFFECTRWQGDLNNKEPHKCEKMEYFPMNRLPHNTLDYIAEAILAASKGEFYSEWGWPTLI